MNERKCSEIDFLIDFCFCPSKRNETCDETDKSQLVKELIYILFHRHINVLSGMNVSIFMSRKFSVVLVPRVTFMAVLLVL